MYKLAKPKQPCPSWSSWSEEACSATCGGGMQISRRVCINTDGSDGGCPGADIREEYCNGNVRFYI